MSRGNPDGSLEGLLPQTALDALTPGQLRTVQEALDQYRRLVDANLSTVLYSEPGGSPARQRLADISKGGARRDRADAKD